MNEKANFQLDLREMLKASFQKNSARTAIRWEGCSISYRKLEQMAGKVCDFLLEHRQQGKGAAFLLDCGPCMTACLIGSLMAGVVFCPVHPQIPFRRIAQLLDQMNARFLFAEEGALPLARQASNQTSSETCPVCVKADPDFKLSLCPDDIRVERDEKNQFDEEVGFLYFSSGTTGIPKGILGRRDSVTQFLSWEAERFQVDPSYIISGLTPPSFDPYLRDTLLPLLTGAALAIPQAQDRTNPYRLLRWLQEEAITLSHMVPSLLRSLLRVLEPGVCFPELPHLLLAGEMLYGRDAAAFYEKSSGKSRIYNLYGPTETTLAKFCYEVSPRDAHRQRIPVGFPIGETKVFVMLPEGKPAALGQEGELWIVPSIPPKGYFNNPELNCERFIKMPDGQIAYRTKDLACQAADKSFELIGRLDHQVKVRGMLVQLEEIEAILDKQPDVERCAALAITKEDESSTLAAAVVPCPGAQGGPDFVRRLREILLESLPEYSVPAAIQVVEEIPQTVSGKIDRMALAALLTGEVKTAVQPLDETQTKLMKIIQQNVDGFTSSQLDKDSVLTELGVDSLNLVSILLEVEEEFQIELGEDSFSMEKFPTIGALMQAIQKAVKG